MRENGPVRCVYESATLAVLLYAAVVLVVYPVLARTWRDGLDPAFASIARSSLSGLAAHGDPLSDGDGGKDFRDAANALCTASSGKPSEPVPAETLAYYPGGYDRYGVNPPPGDARERTVSVPLRWTEYAVVACVQAARTSYLLFRRSLRDQPVGGPATDLAVAEGAGRWEMLENASLPAAALGRRDILSAMEDVVRHDRRNVVQPDRSIPARLAPSSP